MEEQKSEFERKAEELIADIREFRKNNRESIFSALDDNANPDSNNLSAATDVFISSAFVGMATAIAPLTIFGSLLGGLASGFVHHLSKQVQINQKTSYSIKEVSELTGFDEWQLRRMKDDLLPSKDGKSGSNPGKAGHTVSREKLLAYLQKSPSDLIKNPKMQSLSIEYAERQIAVIRALVRSSQDTQQLGDMEVEYEEMEAETDPKAAKKALRKKMTLQNLRIETNALKEDLAILEKVIASTKIDTIAAQSDSLVFHVLYNHASLEGYNMIVINSSGDMYCFGSDLIMQADMQPVLKNKFDLPVARYQLNYSEDKKEIVMYVDDFSLTAEEYSKLIRSPADEKRKAKADNGEERRKESSEEFSYL